MRLAFASDFHGSREHYSGFLNLARQEEVDAAIIGGDLFPVSRPFETMLRAQKEFANTFLRDLFENHRSLRGCPVYLLPGNNDWYSAFQEIQGLQQDGLVASVEPAVCDLIGGYKLVTLPFVPPTPFRLKDFDRRDLAGDSAPDEPNPVYHSDGDEMREADIRDYLSRRLSIQEEIGKLGLSALNADKTIYVMHSPPSQTGLGMTERGVDVGSEAIRTAIEGNQPLITLHGHIHEAPRITGTFACRLGRTVCVNAGQIVERLFAVIVDLSTEIELQHTALGVLSSDNLHSVR